MTGATHLIAGAAVAKASSPYLGPASLLLSLASHYALDAVPHREAGIKGNAVLGVISVAALLTAFRAQGDMILLSGAFLGVLPDLLWIFKVNKALNNVHKFFHVDKRQNIPVLWAVVEAVCGLLFTLYIFW